MFVNRECDYALRIVRALSDGQKHAMSEICEHEHIPKHYAYKILNKLEKKDLIDSFRGVDGGYKLVNSTDDMTLYSVFTAVENDISLNSCMQDGFECPNSTPEKKCGVHNELGRIQQIFKDELNEKTLTEVFKA